MTHRYRYHPEARAELEADVDWYEDRHPGLGGEFLRDVEAAIEDVCAHPDRWPLSPLLGHGLGIRRRVLRRFPYSIVYLVEEARIVVLAVAQEKRRPGYWIERLR